MSIRAQMHGALTIGLTGGIGSGKSTLARLLVEQGAALIDSDAIAHELTAAGGAAITAIAEQFGDEFVEPGGALDRVKMSARVFALAPAAASLVIDVPLLAETGQAAGRFDRILVVDCPADLQIARVLARSSRPRAEVEAIIAGQASRAQRLSIADDVVFNSLTLPALQARALRLHASYLQLASTFASV